MHEIKSIVSSSELMSITYNSRNAKSYLTTLAIASSVILLFVVSSSSIISASAFSGSAANTRPHSEIMVARLTAAPGVVTSAHGIAYFWLSNHGTILHYQIFVHDINNLFMAHIHLHVYNGLVGQIVVWLFPTVAPNPMCLTTPSACEIPGTFNGELAEGSITKADLTGPLAGMTLVTLLGLINSGDAYLNVHTIQNPGGEIQGQIIP
ncbi:MAG: CHRD domain-containing protein [Nitrososphaerales archaeon]